MGVNLVASRSDREMVMAEKNETKLLDMLKKFGTVADYMTEEMVANFYEVNQSAIMNYGNRNKCELSEYGYKAYTNAEIKQLQQINQVDCFKVPPRGLRLYPVKAVIVIGMMLTESQVAEKLRSEIIQTIFGEAENKSSEELMLKVIEKANAPIYAMIEQNNKTLDLLVGMMEEQKEKTQRLEARVTQESTIRKFEDLAEKKFKEACETDTRDIRAQFMAEVDVKITHLDRALKPAEISKLYNKDSKEFNAWLLKLGLQYKEAGSWKIASKYKDEGFEEKTQGPYGEYLCWNLKGCILIFDLLAAKGVYPTLQEAFER